MKTKLDGIATSANNYSISSDLLDEDNFASNSATKVASQQSIKAYVDGQVSSPSGTVTVSDSTANANFPVIFHNESNGLLDDTGALRYNPSTGTLLVPNLVVAGTSTVVDTVTMEAANAIVFEGETADVRETTLTIVDPTADRTITLPDASGTVAISASAGIALSSAGDITANLSASHIPNLATSKITSGTFADARIAASNVTQHQGSITSLGTLTSLTMTSPLTINHAGSDVFADIIGPLNRSLRFVLRDNGDTDSFFFRNAAGTDIMTLARTGTLTGGTGDLIWDTDTLVVDSSTDRVGIGTTAPDTTLHVEGSVLIDAYSVGEDAGLFFREGFLTTDQPSITVWDMTNSGASPDGLSINANDGIRFRENGGEVARFKDGSLGIGTTSPATLLELAGANSTQTINATSGSGAILFEENGDERWSIVQDTVNKLHLSWIGTSKITFDGSGGSGKVGIGTTSPQSPLHVVGNVMITNTDSDNTVKDSRILGRTYTNNDYNLIYGYADATTNRLYLGGGTGTGEPATDIRFFTAALNADTDASGTEAMRITSDGKLGIGETAPSFPLHLKYTDNRTDPQGSGSSSGAGAIGANAQGGGLFIENASTTDGSFASITFRSDTADARIAYQTIGSSLSNEGQMSFFVDSNETGTSQLSLEEVLRLRGGGTGGSPAQAFCSVDLPLDNAQLRLGASQDLRLFHDGTNSYVDSNTGLLRLDGLDGVWLDDGGSNIMRITNSSVLSYRGLDITGDSVHTGNLHLDADNNQLILGAGSDLKIYHDGSNSYIDEEGTGSLIINSSQVAIKSGANAAENMATFITDGAVTLYHNNVAKLATSADGVTVTGTLSATSKSFVIPHPTKEKKTLRHGSLEGPEHGVYVRGTLESKDSTEGFIELPDYWLGLVDEDTITVQLTGKGRFQRLYVVKIEDNKVYVENEKMHDINCYYFVQAERKDIRKMVVEY